MKLLTHNMLACHIKGVKNNYPFKIEAEEVVEREADFDPGKNGVERGTAMCFEMLSIQETICCFNKVCKWITLLRSEEGQHTLAKIFSGLGLHVQIHEHTER